MSDKEYLKAMVDSPTYDLHAMYAKISAEYDDLLFSVYDREDLIEIMYEHAKNGDVFMEMAHDISIIHLLNISVLIRHAGEVVVSQ